MRWHPILEGRYSVSEDGQVRREAAGRGGKPGRIIKGYIDHSGYHIVHLGLGMKHQKKSFKVHRLVCECFNGPPEPGQHVNHIDGIKLNNHYTNLEWCWPKENSQHAVRIGLSSIGTKHHSAKFTDQDIVDICEAHYHGESATSIAERHDCGVATITDILQGVSWRHVKRTVPMVPRVYKPNAILRAKDIPDIFKLSKQGVASRDIAKRYGVTYGAIRDILKRRKWKDVEVDATFLPQTKLVLKGEQVYGAKLNPAKVREMRRLRKYEGWTIPRLAKHFGVRVGNVSFIINYQTWKHVKDEKDDDHSLSGIQLDLWP